MWLKLLNIVPLRRRDDKKYRHTSRIIVVFQGWREQSSIVFQRVFRRLYSKVLTLRRSLTAEYFDVSTLRTHRTHEYFNRLLTLSTQHTLGTQSKRQLRRQGRDIGGCVYRRDGTEDNDLARDGAGVRARRHCRFRMAAGFLRWRAAIGAEDKLPYLKKRKYAAIQRLMGQPRTRATTPRGNGTGSRVGLYVKVECSVDVVTSAVGRIFT